MSRNDVCCKFALESQRVGLETRPPSKGWSPAHKFSAPCPRVLDSPAEEWRKPTNTFTAPTAQLRRAGRCREHTRFCISVSYRDGYPENQIIRGDYVIRKAECGFLVAVGVSKGKSCSFSLHLLGTITCASLPMSASRPDWYTRTKGHRDENSKWHLYLQQSCPFSSFCFSINASSILNFLFTILSPPSHDTALLPSALHHLERRALKLGWTRKEQRGTAER